MVSLKGTFMLKTKKIATAAASMLIATIAMSQEINGIQYNSIDIGYGSASLESGSGSSKIVMDRMKGSGASGTYRVDNVLIGAGYQSAKSDGLTIGTTYYSATTELKLTTIGLGYRFGISPGFDLVPSLSHTSQKVTLKRSGAADSNTDASANTVGLTAYNKLTETLQSNVGFSRNSAEENTISAGLLFKFNKNWGVRGSYGQTSGSDNLKLKQTIVGVSYLY